MSLLRKKSLYYVILVCFVTFFAIVPELLYSFQVKLPDTPAGKRATQLFDVVNSGNRERMRSFLETSFGEKFLKAFPMEEHIQMFSDIYEGSRGFEIHEITKSSEYELNITVKNKLTGLWQTVVVSVEEDNPHLIAGLMFRDAEEPAVEKLSQKLSDEEIVRQLKLFLDKMSEEDVFSGTVLFAKHGRVLFQKAYGMASKRFNVPNTIDTKFNLGSMNKMVTSVAIAQLVEKGELSYEDTIGNYLGDD